MFRSRKGDKQPIIAPDGTHRPRLIYGLYGDYIWAPIIATLSWLTLIIALLIIWIVRDHREQYEPSESRIVFISDVGASHQTLFIILCVITAVFFVISLIFERWLRHVDRIPSVVRSKERCCDITAIVFAIIGAAGLILLSCFSAFKHSTIHWSMTIVFVVFTAASAIAQTVEVWSLSHDHPDTAHLRRNGILKMIIVILAIAVALAFAGLYAKCGGNAGPGYAAKCTTITSAAAACEWAVSFILVFFFATLILDLWPAAKTSPRFLNRVARWEQRHLSRPEQKMSTTMGMRPVSGTGELEAIGAGSGAGNMANQENITQPQQGQQRYSNSRYSQQNTYNPYYTTNTENAVDGQPIISPSEQQPLPSQNNYQAREV